jgi:hypothetical protein
VGERKQAGGDARRQTERDQVEQAARGENAQ